METSWKLQTSAASRRKSPPTAEQYLEVLQKWKVNKCNNPHHHDLKFCSGWHDEKDKRASPLKPSPSNSNAIAGIYDVERYKVNYCSKGEKCIFAKQPELVCCLS